MYISKLKKKKFFLRILLYFVINHSICCEQKIFVLYLRRLLPKRSQKM